MHDKFYVGLKLSLQLDNCYEKIALFLAGWSKTQFILAAGPQLRDVELTSRNACVVRFVKDGVAHAFHTQMLSKLYSPVHLIFFKYPENISSLAVRKSARTRTNIPARIMGLKGKDGLISEHAKMIDLSETGCLLEVASTKLNDTGHGEDFYLTFKVWEESFELDCTVKNIRRNKDHYLVGTAFKHISANNKEIINNFHCMLGVSQRDVPSHIESLPMILP